VTAEDVKTKLLGRHPATSQGLIGEWTCTTEFAGIDFLAISAWGKGRRIGYEVKVSRGDMRSELLEPGKRARAVAMCNEFYFAVPAGLLKDEEIAFEEPEWEPGDFERKPCPGVGPFGDVRAYRGARFERGSRYDRRYPGVCHKKRGRGYYSAPGYPDLPRGKSCWVEVPVPVVLRDPEELQAERGYPSNTFDLRYQLEERGRVCVVCPTCGGTGYLRKSRVERCAPTLWVPRDVGLVTVSARGCRVVKKAPVRVPRELHWKEVAQLVRWVSVRPDPRHRGLAAARLAPASA
jgi:hypothetical protein